MVMTGIEPLEGILTADETELLSCLLRHQCIDGLEVHAPASIQS